MDTRSLTWFARPTASRAITVAVALSLSALGAGPVVAGLPLPVNLPPVALPDTATTPLDTVLRVAAPGVLANDVDPNGDAMVATLKASATYGAVALAADGSYTYWPRSNWAGVDTFAYCAADQSTCSLTVLVTITVTGVPKPSPTPPLPTPTPPLPTPSLPIPTATPPIPTTSPPLPTPSLPVPTVDPGGSPSPTPSGSPRASGEPSSGGAAAGGGSNGIGGPGETPPPIRVASLDSIPMDGMLPAGAGRSPITEWAVPATALAIPGLLVLLFAAAQAVGGLAWLPVVRRALGGSERSAGRSYRYIVRSGGGRTR